MNLEEASVKHVEDCIESGYAHILGSLLDPSKVCSHVLDDICWSNLNKEEVYPFLDVMPINRDEPNNLILLLPPFNHKEFK
jgi:hypothetical protein